MKMKFALEQLVNNATEFMTVDENPTIEKITRIFESIRSIVTDYEKKLKQRIRAIEKRNKALVEKFQKGLRNKQEKLNEQNQNFEAMISANDHTKLLQDHRTSMHYLTTTTKQLNELKYPTKIKYHIEEINQLQQNIIDILQQVSIDEEQQGKLAFTLSDLLYSYTNMKQ